VRTSPSELDPNAPTGLERGSYSAGRSGSESVMLQPRVLGGLGVLACGGASVMVMRPPWASATRRARVRPRP